jgi:hypothetical protein
MVLTKEYRICMPLTVEEVKVPHFLVFYDLRYWTQPSSCTDFHRCCLLQYQIGQLYMIARHSHEQTDAGEGVEVVENVACEDSEHGKGQYTEKRIHLSRYCLFVNWKSQIFMYINTGWLSYIW